MKQLHDLDPAEVSLVPRGAVQRKFLILKSRDGERMTREELSELFPPLDDQTVQRLEQVFKALGDTPQEGSEQATLDKRAQAALKAITRIYAPFKDVLTPEVVMQAIEAAGPQGGDQEMADKKDKVDDSKVDPKDKAHQEALEMAKKAYCDHMQKSGFQKKGDKEPTEKSLTEEVTVKAEPKEEKDMAEENKDTVAKSLDLSALPKEVQPALQAIFKAQEELVQKNASLEKELSGVRREAKRKDFLVEIEKEFTHLGMDKNELASTFLALSETNPDQLVAVKKMLGAANEQAKAGGIFKEIGSSQGGSGKTTWEMIESAAVAVVQKSGEKLTAAEATDRFLATSEGSRMYNDYMTNHPSSQKRS